MVDVSQPFLVTGNADFQWEFEQSYKKVQQEKFGKNKNLDLYFEARGSNVFINTLANEIVSPYGLRTPNF